MQAVVSRVCATTTDEIRRPPCIKSHSPTGKADMRITESRAARICRPQRQARRLAASVQNELTNLFVAVVVVEIIELIIEHPLRYLLPCCVDAGGWRVSSS
jgi:hypothetical protein